jgi:3-hydroxyisobutyrate dehydrogenase-like beta-hydroxyacid dehydrogenase
MSLNDVQLVCQTDGVDHMHLMLKDESDVDEARVAAARSIGHHAAYGEIGFVGLGAMGSAMAANLVTAGYQLIGYVRRPQRMGRLRALGLKPTTDISDLFHCDIIISMVPDDVAARDVVLGGADGGVEGLAAGLKAGAVHLSMSTISTTTAHQLAGEHARCDQGYVAAPVFGNPDAARARQLFVIAAGAPVDVDRCWPIMNSLGQRTFVIGTDPADANLYKLLGNTMTATALEALAEVIALIRKRGLDPKPFIDVMTSSMFGGRVHGVYGDKIVKQSFAPGFVIPLALKDVRLALTEADIAGVPMPSVGVVKERLTMAIARGHGDLDWTALGLIAEEESAETRLGRTLDT